MYEDCPDCDGMGVFEHPDDMIDVSCDYCGGAGIVQVDDGE